MFIEVGIMFAAYFGVRIYERYKDIKEPGKETLNIEPSKDIAKDSLGDDDINGSNHELQHYHKAGLASMGVSFLRESVFPVLAPFSLGLYIYTAMPYMKRVEDSLAKDRKVNVDVLFFLADALTLGASQYFTASLGVWLMNAGKMSVEMAKDQSGKSIIDVFDQLPQKVWVLMDNVEVEFPLKNIKINDIVVANTGEKIPVDGIVTEGMATVDQHTLTGESQPAEKTVGDRVFAGTIVFAGRICIKVEKSGEDTTFSKIRQILTNSTDFKTGVQLKGEKWADNSTLPMLGASCLMLPFTGPVTTAVFINSHIGNRIRVLAPMVTLNHITAASEKGILIKDGRAIESLSEIDTILFDKTGTLTTEVPKIGDINLYDNYKEEEILCFAAVAEHKFTHPIATAIRKKFEEINLLLPDMDDLQYKIGYGITVIMNGTVLRVGSMRFMMEEKITIPSKVSDIQNRAHRKGNSLIYVAVNDKISGSIELKPQVRTEVREIISGLRSYGIEHIAIVSGDHRGPTEKLAKELDMDDYYYDILPEKKAEIVEKLQKEGRSVCYIGDGINDAIAMKKANVSISLSGAASIATDTAEVVLMDGSLSHLYNLFDISKRLHGKLKKCLAYTIAPGVANFSGAFIFHYSILTSMLVNAGFGIVAMKDAMLPPKEITRK